MTSAQQAISSSGQGLLILSPFFDPERISTGRYNLTMAEELAQTGAQVTVACCHSFYPAWKPEYSGAELPGMQIRCGDRYLRFPASTMLRRALLEVWFACFAMWQVWRLRKQLITVVAVFPTSLLFLGVNAVLPRGARRVGVFHDLQGVHAGASKSALMRALVGIIVAIERRAFGACDRLNVLSAAWGRKLVETAGVDFARVTVVYPFANLLPAAPDASRLTALFSNSFVHLVYSGALGEKQNPDRLAEIFEAASKENPEVCVQVFSEGPSFNRLRSRLESRAVPRALFHGSCQIRMWPSFTAARSAVSLGTYRPSLWRAGLWLRSCGSALCRHVLSLAAETADSRSC